MIYPTKPINRALWIASFLLPLVVYTACSNGGGGSDGLLAGGGIGGTGITLGSISRFGSIYVNGIEFDTGTAKVVIGDRQVGSGDPAVQDFLSVGMVVRVEGPGRNDGKSRAHRIVFSKNLQGPVDSISAIDEFNQRLIILGQTVIMNDLTTFKNTAFDLIEKDNVLEVSGFVDDEGVIHATYIAKKADFLLPGDEVVIKGILSDVNTLQQTFRINLLTVDYRLADVGTLPGGAPADEQFVSVTGTLQGDSLLLATKIQLEDALGTDNAEDAEIEGIVSTFSSPARFTIGHVSVEIDDATSFDGLASEDITLGTMLRVKGALNNKILLADRVIAEDAVKLQSKVAAVDLQQNAVLLSGLESIFVRVNDLTRILGNANALEEIQVGDSIRIFGRSVADNEVLASMAKVNPASNDKVILQGPVTNISPPVINIVGTAADTLMLPENGFKLSAGGTLTQEEFLNMIRLRDIVDAEGTLIGNSVQWKEMTLRRDD